MDKEKLVKELKEFRGKTSKKYGVKKLILFGSYAKGNPKEHSDADLIVVGDFKDRGNINRDPLLYHEWHIAQKIDLPVDFLCYTPKEFERLKNQVSIVSQALKEGIEIM